MGPSLGLDRDGRYQDSRTCPRRVRSKHGAFTVIPYPSWATQGRPLLILQAEHVQSPTPHFGLVQLVLLLHQAQLQVLRQYMD